MSEPEQYPCYELYHMVVYLRSYRSERDLEDLRSRLHAICGSIAHE
jgi:hypothetical protein